MQSLHIIEVEPTLSVSPLYSNLYENFPYNFSPSIVVCIQVRFLFKFSFPLCRLVEKKAAKSVCFHCWGTNKATLHIFSNVEKHLLIQENTQVLTFQGSASVPVDTKK